MSSNWRLWAGRIRDQVKEGSFKVPLVGKMLWRRKEAELCTVPNQLNIEVTSICNAKCVMCPRLDMERDMEVMPWAMYQKIIDEAAELGTHRFALNGYGEIFTAKRDYRKFIEYIRQKIPHARIIINTNASLMNAEVAQFLIDMKVDNLHINIDGASKESFEKIRVNLHYDTVVKNVRRLMEMRKLQNRDKPRVRVAMILQPGNRHEVELFHKQWEGVTDYVGDDFLVNRAGSVSIEHETIIGNPCYLVWGEMNIWTDGSVALCCDDWDGKAKMGNVKEQTIGQIWAGSQFSKVRELHKTGNADKVPLCSQCSWSRPGPTWFEHNIAGGNSKNTAGKSALKSNAQHTDKDSDVGSIDSSRPGVSKTTKAS